jgi:transposase
MLSLPPAVRIFVSTQGTDMRYGFDRLAMLTQTVLAQDPFSGHLFVFFNKRAI